MRGYHFRLVCVIYILYFTCLPTEGIELAKEEVDKVIEDEITHKLGEDLLQSIERKFQVDLEKSVDMVLVKIKLLLQNGTSHIQEKLGEIQVALDAMQKETGQQVDICLLKRQNETSALAEKALHQMVVCGYALIGHDPAQAVKNVIALKSMIKQGMKPIYEQKSEVYRLLKICGHDHETLKKVIKCVIAKSPLIKSAMMDVTSKLIEGVVGLTKLMAHGAMHEACLIEVVKTVEEEAIVLLREVKACAYGNNTAIELQKYLAENNATVLDLTNKTNITQVKLVAKTDNDTVSNTTSTVSAANNSSTVANSTGGNSTNGNTTEVIEVIRRMLTNNRVQDLETSFAKKLQQYNKETEVDTNDVPNDIKEKGKN